MHKVQNGTPNHTQPSLCRSCRHATVITGQRLAEDVILCDEMCAPHNRVCFVVTACSNYDDKSQPSLSAMRAIAWSLCTDKEGRRIGFLSPFDIQKRGKGVVAPGWAEEPDILRD
jgi:hypothetical protein